MDEDVYTTLVYKKLEGEIQHEEQVLLDKWLNESESNRQLAKEIEEIWRESASLSPEVEVDLNTEFDKLLGKIDPEEAAKDPIPLRPKRPQKLWIGVAATVAILISAIGVYQFIIREDPVVMQEFVAVKNNFQANLPDGSLIVLKNGGVAKYPSRFESDERVIELNGEAYFEVEKNASQPFRVVGGGIEVKVIGTRFYVSTGSGSESNAVNVVSGKVEVRDPQTDASVLLEKGESTRFKPGDGNIEKSGSDPNDLFWHTKELVFLDTELEEVVVMISKSYKINIDVQNPELRSCLVTSTFRNASAEVVLGDITRILNAEVETPSKDKFIITGGSCL